MRRALLAGRLQGVLGRRSLVEGVGAEEFELPGLLGRFGDGPLLLLDDEDVGDDVPQVAEPLVRLLDRGRFGDEGPGLFHPGVQPVEPGPQVGPPAGPVLDLLEPVHFLPGVRPGLLRLVDPVLGGDQFDVRDLGDAGHLPLDPFEPPLQLLPARIGLLMELLVALEVNDPGEDLGPAARLGVEELFGPPLEEQHAGREGDVIEPDLVADPGLEPVGQVGVRDCRPLPARRIEPEDLLRPLG